MKNLAVFLASLLVLILIVFVGLPGFLGSQVENRLFEVIDEEFYSDYIELELIDFHGFINSERVRDSGFMWWDYVHLSSHAQKMAGEYFADQIFGLYFEKEAVDPAGETAKAKT